MVIHSGGIMIELTVLFTASSFLNERIDLFKSVVSVSVEYAHIIPTTTKSPNSDSQNKFHAPLILYNLAVTR